MSGHIIRKPYGDRSRHPITFADVEPMTVQYEKDSCDINRIIDKYQQTGVLSHVNSRIPLEGDFTEVSDFRSCLEILERAQDSFDDLPADVRNRFANDPAKFLDFVYDESNRDEAVNLGLITLPSDAGHADSDGPDQLPT